MRDSNLEFRIVDPGPSNFGYAAIISLESGLLKFRDSDLMLSGYKFLKLIFF